MSPLTRTVVNLIRWGILESVRCPAYGATYWRRVAHALDNRRTRVPAIPSVVVPTISREIVEDAAIGVGISLADWRFTYGNMPLKELIVLLQLVRICDPEALFEIGTFYGMTTLQLAANSHARIQTLDLPPNTTERVITDETLDVYPNEPGAHFKNSLNAGRITQLFGDSMTFDFSPYLGSMDFVLVDGNHHYEYIMSDSENALDILSDSGMVVWHDYAPHAPDVMEALKKIGARIPLWHIGGTSLVIHDRGQRIAVSPTSSVVTPSAEFARCAKLG